MYKVGIVGLGHVGSLMQQLFPDAAVYDEPKEIGSRDSINATNIAFVCVPTPMSEDGSCDTSCVDSVFSWIKADVVVIRSTVPVGYTNRMAFKTGLSVVFQPEYYGETTAHPFENPRNRNWITLGGDKVATKKVANLYKTVFTSDIVINQVDAKTAELAKYMENCFLATKVTFCNQFYDLAEVYGVNYDDLRETWLLDPRIGRSHTFVYEDNRGFGGSCLPKDLAATIHMAKTHGISTPLLNSVAETNKLYKG